jgi:putative transposase
VMDAYSRLIVGWSIADHMRTELVTDALGMAIIRRQPEKQPDDERTILHSDHGCQDTSWAFGKRLRAAGLLASMGTVGDCYDNAMIESFWARCNSNYSTRKHGRPATNLPTPSSSG